MRFIDVISKLFNGNSSEKLSILNKAEHVQSLSKKPLYCVATGYSFEIHTGNRMEILYDPLSEIIITQLAPAWRPFNSLLGFNMKLEEGYYQLLANTSKGEIMSFNSSVESDLILSYTSFDYASNYKSGDRLFIFKGSSGNVIKQFPLFQEEPDIIFWDERGSRNFKISNEFYDSIDKQISSLRDKIKRETDLKKRLELSRQAVKLENSRGRLDYDADFFKSNIQEYAMNDFISNDYWTCDACGGDEETGCMMSDPQDCSRN